MASVVLCDRYDRQGAGNQANPPSRAVASARGTTTWPRPT